MSKVKGSDWKKFRALREVALERMYARILGEIEERCQDTARPADAR